MLLIKTHGYQWARRHSWFVILLAAALSGVLAVVVLAETQPMRRIAEVPTIFSHSIQMDAKEQKSKRVANKQPKREAASVAPIGGSTSTVVTSTDSVKPRKASAKPKAVVKKPTTNRRRVATKKPAPPVVVATPAPAQASVPAPVEVPRATPTKPAPIVVPVKRPEVVKPTRPRHPIHSHRPDRDTSRPGLIVRPPSIGRPHETIEAVTKPVVKPVETITAPILDPVVRNTVEPILKELVRPLETKPKSEPVRENRHHLFGSRENKPLRKLFEGRDR